MKRHIGTTLIYTGTAVCALGVLGLGMGAYANLPREVLVFIAYAAPFGVGAAVMAAGAWVARTARLSAPPRTETLLSPGMPSSITEPSRFRDLRTKPDVRGP